jgi:hypothetical protein
MTDGTPDRETQLWEVLGPAIPADLAGKRVLDVAPAGNADRVSTELASRGADLLLRADLDAEWEQAGYDLVVCRDVIQRDPHPARLLTRIWGVMAEGGTLLLHSPVMTEPENSHYARFVAAGAGSGSTEWLPGRLALRWSVETSGFDVGGWLATGDGGESGIASAALVADRTTRLPSLMLATPTEPEEVADGRG